MAIIRIGALRRKCSRIAPVCATTDSIPLKNKVLCSLVENAFSWACRTEQAALSAAGGKQAISGQAPQCLYLYALVFAGQRLLQQGQPQDSIKAIQAKVKNCIVIKEE